MTKTKNNNFWFFILVCVFLQTNIINAQKTWSLQECIDYALIHNLQLNTLNYRAETRKEKHKQSYREFLPSINANTSYRVRYGRSIDDENKVTFNDNFSNLYAISATFNIFQGFKKLNTVAASKFIYKALKEETLQEKYLLAFRTMNAYYGVLFAQGLLKISKEQVSLSTKNYEFLKKQIQLGLKAGVDVYEAESILINDKLELTKSKNRLRVAKLKLQQEMNIEVKANFEVNGLEKEIPLFQIVKNVQVDSLYKTALSFLPNIYAQEYYVAASRKEVQIAKGNLLPSLSFSAGYATSFFETNTDDENQIIPFKQQFENNSSQFISLNLRIPIFNKWSYRSQIKQQKIAFKNTVNQQNIEKQELYKTIQELVQVYEDTRVAYELSQKNEIMRALAFQIAQKKYDKGLLSLLELDQSKTLYIKAQNENLQAKLKLEIYKKTIAFYNGIKVFNQIAQKSTRYK